MVDTYAVNCNDAWLQTKGDDLTGSYVKYEDYAELERRLLAAEAQEPVAWLVHTKQPDPFTTRQRRIAEKAAARGLALTPLYTAPPAPVAVPDEMTMQKALSAINQLSWQECTRDAYMLGWNACRADMLPKEVE